VTSTTVIPGTPTPLVANLSGVGPFAVDSTFVAWSSVLDGESGVSGLMLLAR
jgi:hypothetical protein